MKKGNVHVRVLLGVGLLLVVLGACSAEGGASTQADLEPMNRTAPDDMR
ncbi:MAG: hypothetical protein LC641_10935 [Spirochaeta sp.]|nr:hypothetical protein [Spirochaeta sp.]